jgi:hypothetical protein
MPYFTQARDAGELQHRDFGIIRASELKAELGFGSWVPIANCTTRKKASSSL